MRLTPGKPNSYSPKPTRDTKGTTESGLKNLKKEVELRSLGKIYTQPFQILGIIVKYKLHCINHSSALDEL